MPLLLPLDCSFCLLFILAAEPPKRRKEGQERKEERETVGEERRGESLEKWTN